MNALIAFHSRTGNTRLVAKEIARLVGGDTEEISVKGDRSGRFGYMLCGFESSWGLDARISPPLKNPSGYDLLIIGGPIWSFTLSSPIRAYLKRYGAQAKKIAFFCTMGGMGSEKAFSEMSRICGKKAVATLAIKENEIKDGSYKRRIDGFAKSLS